MKGRNDRISKVNIYKTIIDIISILSEINEDTNLTPENKKI